MADGGVDAAFPPSDSSLFSDPTASPPPGAAPLQWLLPSDFSDAASQAADESALYGEPDQPIQLQQGQLSDLWLLSAMGALANRPELVKRLISPCAPPASSSPGDGVGSGERQRRRLYTVSLFRDGIVRHNVVVDDLLPCFADGRPAYASAFVATAAGADMKGSGGQGSMRKYVLWPMLVEKAFAKLSGCYQALAAGSSTTSQAMADLTGGFPWRVRFDEDKGDGSGGGGGGLSTNIKQQIADGSIWSSLTSQLAAGYLVGVTLAGVDGDKAAEAAAKGVAGSNRGILSNRMYSIQALKETGGTQLAKLSNCWGPEAAWTGRYGVDSGGNRATNTSFWMSFADLLETFTKVLVCMTVSRDQLLAQFTGRWQGKSAAGCVTATQWVYNPQCWLGRAVGAPALAQHLYVCLSQPDGRDQSLGTAEADRAAGAGAIAEEEEEEEEEDVDSSSSGYKAAIGFFVVKADGVAGEQRKLPMSSLDEVVASCPFTRTRSVYAHVVLPPAMPATNGGGAAAGYCIVPSTYAAGQEMPFTLTVCALREEEGVIVSSGALQPDHDIRPLAGMEHSTVPIIRRDVQQRWGAEEEEERSRPQREIGGTSKSSRSPKDSFKGDSFIHLPARLPCSDLEGGTVLDSVQADSTPARLSASPLHRSPPPPSSLLSSLAEEEAPSSTQTTTTPEQPSLQDMPHTTPEAAVATADPAVHAAESARPGAPPVLQSSGQGWQGGGSPSSAQVNNAHQQSDEQGAQQGEEAAFFFPDACHLPSLNNSSGAAAAAAVVGTQSLKSQASRQLTPPPLPPTVDNDKQEAMRINGAYHSPSVAAPAPAALTFPVDYPICATTPAPGPSMVIVSPPATVPFTSSVDSPPRAQPGHMLPPPAVSNPAPTLNSDDGDEKDYNGMVNSLKRMQDLSSGSCSVAPAAAVPAAAPVMSAPPPPHAIHSPEKPAQVDHKSDKLIQHLSQSLADSNAQIRLLMTEVNQEREARLLMESVSQEFEGKLRRIEELTESLVAQETAAVQERQSVREMTREHAAAQARMAMELEASRLDCSKMAAELETTRLECGKLISANETLKAHVALDLTSPSASSLLPSSPAQARAVNQAARVTPAVESPQQAAQTKARAALTKIEALRQQMEAERQTRRQQIWQ